MSGRSQTFSHPEAPHGQRHSPHAAPQEHPPTSTLLLRGLARSVDDEMNAVEQYRIDHLHVIGSLTVRFVIPAQILRALQSFRPLQARTIYDKATGEPRGFAFVDFDSVESAMQAMNAFESRPLVLQHRDVNVSYTDGFRRRSPEDSNRPQDQRQGERWKPRPDWICDEAATNALQKCAGLVVQNTHVEVSYARDTLTTRSQYVADLHPGPRTGSSMVVTALEQAQWSLSQGRGADATTDQQNSVDQDVNALLEGAAAAVVPRFEEPKKMWPPPFESAGGSYMYVSEYGLYWDPDSLFYYDAHTMVYHNSFTGAYYRCVAPESSGASAFQLFVPPLPVDDEVYNETTTATIPAASKPALSLSLKKDKKKAAGISFAIKTTAFASAASVSETNSQVKAAGSGVVPPAASAVSVTSIGIKRKSADDIAKWSQRQREAKQHEAGNTSTAPTQQANNSSEQKTVRSATSAADSVIDALTNVPQEVPICLLCRRKFGSLEMLRKHEKLSKLHLANLAKANKNKQHIAAQYREHEKEMERDAKKQRQEEYPPSVPSNNWSAPTPGSSSNPEPTASSLESGFGGKMLKLMGWKSGDGLGKHGSGITAPINAAGQGGRSDTAGLGSKAPLSASVDLSDVTSDKERRQRLARARYDTP
ncbi:hypothetical protein JG688_00005710 [Phytophthora aleatoria]|uniref:G-patch domain-containing protein n=1 Tax=Phytophthora aleatoria TaxID=2496075 RepID=A0A8J5J846_9STRA|nr:hypothetical protein JG688_00005710 [Phytophthora aleatoria]